MCNNNNFWPLTRDTFLPIRLQVEFFCCSRSPSTLCRNRHHRSRKSLLFEQKILSVSLNNLRWGSKHLLSKNGCNLSYPYFLILCRNCVLDWRKKTDCAIRELNSWSECYSWSFIRNHLFTSRGLYLTRIVSRCKFHLYLFYTWYGIPPPQPTSPVPFHTETFVPPTYHPFIFLNVQYWLGLKLVNQRKLEKIKNIFRTINFNFVENVI